MSFTMTSSVRKVRDHFEPEANLDPQEQRAMRAHLEQIDYAAFAANREVLSKIVGPADLNRFERLAVAAAQARGRWVSSSLAVSQKGEHPTPQEIAQLAAARSAYTELAEAYEALRRMVERGYVPFRAKT